MDDELYLNASVLEATCGGNDTMNRNVSFEHLNVSGQYPVDLAIPLYGYAMPVLLLVTTVANTLIVAVLWQPHMRSPTNAVLMAMALSDMLTVVFPEPMFFYMYTLDNHAKPLHPPAACYAWDVLHEAIPTMFHTASIWLTVLLATQRYISVCHPSRAPRWCTQSIVTWAIVWVFFFAAIHQTPRVLENHYESAQMVWEGQCTWVCKVTYNSWVTRISLDVYYPIYFWFRVVFVHLGPCTVLVVLNVLLFKALKEAQKRRKKLLNDKSSGKECRKLRDHNTTLMLIVVVSVFLVTEIPLAVITVLHIISNSGLKIFSEEAYDSVMRFFIISNSFIIFSYPINFAIYCGMSRQFRETFRDLFVRGGTQAWRRIDSTRDSRGSMYNGRTRNCRSLTSETII